MVRQRIQKQPVFVISRRPYSETSLVIDAFSRHHGRISLLAKGARRLKSPYRGILHPFTTLLIDWTGKGSLMTLTSADCVRRPYTYGYENLMCAWYANELITRFLHRNDPHELLFDRYSELLEKIDNNLKIEWSLRLFEKHILAETGYGLNLYQEAASNKTIEPHTHYHYIPEIGLVRQGDAVTSGILVKGSALIHFDQEIYPSPEDQAGIKGLTRYLLNWHMKGRELRSRRIFREINRHLPRNTAPITLENPAETQ